MRFLSHTFFIAAVLLISASPLFADVPGQVNFQGHLFNDQGQPINNDVNFDFSLFDAETGGTQLWTESQANIPVSNGVYDVSLGAMQPLTPSVLAGPAVYLEIVIDGETLTPRQRLLAVPYALEAEEARNVGGIPNTFIQQIFLFGNHDNSDPSNSDPREGFDDVDNDGMANFIDVDNDGDGLSDSDEISSGSDINLSTPTISSVIPSKLSIKTPTTFTVTGTSFEPGSTIMLDGEALVPQNLTATSMELTVSAGHAIGAESLILTSPNGESATSVLAFISDNYVFVTSGVFTPSTINGLAGADAICNQAAADASLPGSYVAFLSDSTTDARDRLPSVPGLGWYRTDEVKVASDLDTILNNSLDASIHITEYGLPIVAPGLAWTGSDFSSYPSYPTNTCGDWSNDINYARSHLVSYADLTVSNPNTLCSTALRLICFRVTAP